VRVTPELTVLDTVYICNQAAGQNIPAIAFNGIDYIVVWYDAGLPEGIVAARVTPQGAVLDSGISLGPGDDDPDIASGNGNSVAVWSRDYDGVYGRRLDQQAQPLDTVFRICAITASGTSPRIAGDGQNYMAVWADFGPTGDLDVVGRIVTGQGQTPADVFPIARGNAVQKDPGLSFDGSRYLTVWLEDNLNVFGQLIGTDGKLIAGPFLISDTASLERQYPAAAAVGGDFLAVWAEYHDGFDIYAGLGNAINVPERGSDRVAGLSVAPNPFRTRTDIRRGITDNRSQMKKLQIFDISGRAVKSFSLTDIGHPSSVIWRGEDNVGRPVSPGVYFLRSGDGRQVKVVKIE